MNDIKEKYTCDACRYTFESDKLLDRCPDCGKLQVRRASESEIYEYEHRFEGVRSFFCKLAFYGKIVFFRQGFQPMP